MQEWRKWPNSLIHDSWFCTSRLQYRLCCYYFAYAHRIALPYVLAQAIIITVDRESAKSPCRHYCPLYFQIIFYRGQLHLLMKESISMTRNFIECLVASWFKRLEYFWNCRRSLWWLDRVFFTDFFTGEENKPRWNTLYQYSDESFT